MPDEDKNFGGSLVLEFEHDDVTGKPRIAFLPFSVAWARLPVPVRERSSLSSRGVT